MERVGEGDEGREEIERWDGGGGREMGGKKEVERSRQRERDGDRDGE